MRRLLQIGTAGILVAGVAAFGGVTGRTALALVALVAPATIAVALRLVSGRRTGPALPPGPSEQVTAT
jgi:hypothetical protein